MPPRPARIRDTAEPAMVGIHPRWLKLGLLFCLVAAALVGVFQVDRTNQRLQVEARFKDDPSLALWLDSAREAIRRNATTAATPDGVVAVWVGTVSDVKRKIRSGSRPPVDTLAMRPAWLLAGTRGPKDEAKGAATLTVPDNFTFVSGDPSVGEVWAFAVQRINGGFNRLVDARQVR